MRVAHTHCYELLVSPIHVDTFINRVYQSTAIATSGMWTRSDRLWFAGLWV